MSNDNFKFASKEDCDTAVADARRAAVCRIETVLKRVAMLYKGAGLVVKQSKEFGQWKLNIDLNRYNEPIVSMAPTASEVVAIVPKFSPAHLKSAMVAARAWEAEAQKECHTALIVANAAAQDLVSQFEDVR